MDFNQININANIYDDLFYKIKDLEWLTFEEMDGKFGLKFIKTVKEKYIFEVRDKNKYLIAKIIYDI